MKKMESKGLAEALKLITSFNLKFHMKVKDDPEFVSKITGGLPAITDQPSTSLDANSSNATDCEPTPEDDGDAKRLRELNHIVEELISTECDYLKSLYFLQKEFLKPIQPMLTVKKERAASEGVRNIIKMMHNFGTFFLGDLSSSSSSTSSPEGCVERCTAIGAIFIAHRRLFALYAKLTQRWNTYMALLERADIQAHIRHLEARAGEPMGFERYVRKPLQRLGKYELLLVSMHKQLEALHLEDNAPTLSIDAAKQLINGALHRCNTILALAAVEYVPFTDAESGNFLMRMSMKQSLRSPRVPRQKHTREVEVLLFQRVVIIATQIQEELQFVDAIKAANLAKVDHVERPLRISLEDFSKTGRDGRARHTIELEAPTPAEKHKFISAIDELLWRQLKQLRTEAQEQRKRLTQPSELQTTEL